MTPQTPEPQPKPPRISFARRKLLGEGAWVVVGKLSSILAAFVGMRLLTEYLHPSVYGHVGLLIGLTGLGNLLTCMPLSQAAFRFYPEMTDSNDLRGLRRLAGTLLYRASLVLMSVIVVVGSVYAFAKDQPFSMYLFLALLTGAEVAQTFEQNLLGAARRQRPVAIWQLTVAWGRPLLAILAVIVFGAHATSVLIGYFVAVAGTWLLLRVFRFPFEGASTPSPSAESTTTPATLSSSQRSQIMAYAWPLVPLGIVGWVHSLGDRYIIEEIIGLEAAGLYIAAYNLIMKPYNITEGVFQQTLLPAYNQAISSRNIGQERRLFRAWFLGLSAIVLLGCVCVYFLNTWVATLLLAKAYRPSATLMPWLGLGFAFLAIAHVFEWRLYSLKATRLVLLGQTIAAITSIAVAIPMVLKYKLMGAAMACPLYYALYLLTMFVLSQWAIRQYYRSKPDTATPA
ncbi:MAG: lipopolysaccharide biosynthesis protein [Deltaproteobacteria bacterium]|nr:MAG: lipopolysaccharide biosynthesis protein [Deltaproteobacteria bacterium]